MSLSENAMYLYGIRLCVIEIKISNIQLNASLNKRNQALPFHCKYVTGTIYKYHNIVDCKYIGQANTNPKLACQPKLDKTVFILN